MCWLAVFLGLAISGPSVASPLVRECLPATDESSGDLKDLEAAAAALLQAGRFGPYFDDLLKSRAIVLCWDPEALPARGYHEPESNIISVASGLSRAAKMLILAHELRHVDQLKRGYVLSLKYDMREYVRQTYAVEADAQSFVILLAWSLRQAGNETLWREVVRLERYEDMAEAFEEMMRTGAPPTEAMRHTFTVWYRSPWRREAYFQTSGMRYLDQREEKHAIPASKQLPDDHFDQLCRMPDGTNYGCHKTKEIADRNFGHPFR